MVTSRRGVDVRLTDRLHRRPRFLTGSAAAGVTKLGTEIAEVLTLGDAHGTEPLISALERAVAFGRSRADDVRSILATNGHGRRPIPAGQALAMTLPTVPARSLDAYAIQPAIEGLEGGDGSRQRRLRHCGSPPERGGVGWCANRLRIQSCQRVSPRRVSNLGANGTGGPRTLCPAQIGPMKRANCVRSLQVGPCMQVFGRVGEVHVRGHEKVPTGGQVRVPAGGRIEVPTLRVVS